MGAKLHKFQNKQYRVTQEQELRPLPLSSLFSPFQIRPSVHPTSLTSKTVILVHPYCSHTAETEEPQVTWR